MFKIFFMLRDSNDRLIRMQVPVLSFLTCLVTWFGERGGEEASYL